jgi:hypothetical protein
MEWFLFYLENCIESVKSVVFHHISEEEPRDEAHSLAITDIWIESRVAAKQTTKRRLSLATGFHEQNVTRKRAINVSFDLG